MRTRFLALLTAFACLLATAPAALAGTANAGVPGAPRSNPLAGMPWGVYTGAGNGVYSAYASATSARRRLFAKIARRPLAYWFGAWVADGAAASDVRGYIANLTAGNPDVLAQVAVFRLDPWEQAACTTRLSSSAQRSYRRWIDGFARGIGSSRVAVILQPDLAFAMCAPNRTPLALVAYAARVFSKLPHTTVYVDAGAHWFPMRTSQAVWMLEQAGIRYARGFALNTTEYDATGAELRYGSQIAADLAAAGLGTKHMVINTAENGAPFLNGQYHGNPKNPRVCRNRADHICATLGIPPTWHTSAAGLGLSGAERAIAARLADAYLWIGRPWLDNGSDPFDPARALGLAASTPFA
jgi:hypothetical protein